MDVARAEDRWKALIGRLFLVKQEVCAADPEQIFKLTYPGVANDAESVRRAEERLGEAFDVSSAQMYTCIDGWEQITMDVDLFGLKDLGAGARYQRAMLLLVGAPSELLASAGPSPLPIAVSRYRGSVYLLARRSAPSPGRIIWYCDGEIVDEFDNAELFVEGILAYQMRWLEEFGKKV